MTPLQLTLSFEPGGRREAILTLTHGLAAEGVVCDLACVEQLGCEPAVVEPLFRRAETLRRDKAGMRAAVRRLVRLCDERGSDLIHAHDAASQWVAARLRLARPKIKLLMTFHRSLGFESTGWKAKLRNAAAGFATAAVVVGSRERRAHYLAENYVPRTKVVRIPFGVDLARFWPDPAARQAVRQELNVPEGELLVGAAGHFGPEKGIDLAIRGFLAFQQANPSRRAKLVVIGRGTAAQEETIRNLAAAGGDAIVLAGFRPDVERYFAALDVFMHVPRQEAFGLVVAEAMACGVPVVASSVGGVPDMAREGKTGCLVPPEDLAAVATVVAQLAGDEALRGRLSAGALRVAQTEYSETLYVKRHLDLYHQMLAGRRPSGVAEEPMADEIATQEPEGVAARAVAEEVCHV